MPTTATRRPVRHALAWAIAAAVAGMAPPAFAATQDAAPAEQVPARQEAPVEPGPRGVFAFRMREEMRNPGLHDRPRIIQPVAPRQEPNRPRLDRG